MLEPAVVEPPSLFRTAAWINAWAKIWGDNAGIQVVDIGAPQNPMQQLYLCRNRVKKVLPIISMHLMGVGSRQVSTPRAEYINLHSLLAHTTIEKLASRLAQLPWHQFLIPDVIQGSVAEVHVWALAKALGVNVYREKTEIAYRVAPGSCHEYWQSLGANTRLRYYNRRTLLSSHGAISLSRYSLSEVSEFISRLNNFHVERWGQACYGEKSIQFMTLFLTELNHQGGEIILEAMRVGGQEVSLLLDIVWQGYRYNLQSGFVENKYPKIALGALHMGYAIEAALSQGQGYDFMAGQGKNSNYKQHISNQQITLVSYALERGRVKHLRSLQQLLLSKR